MSNLPKPKSNVVWSRDKGWHDDPPIEVKVQVKPDPERASITAAIHAAAQRASLPVVDVPMVDPVDHILDVIFGK